MFIVLACSIYCIGVLLSVNKIKQDGFPKTPDLSWYFSILNFVFLCTTFNIASTSILFRMFFRDITVIKEERSKICNKLLIYLLLADTFFIVFQYVLYSINFENKVSDIPVLFMYILQMFEMSALMVLITVWKRGIVASAVVIVICFVKYLQGFLYMGHGFSFSILWADNLCGIETGLIGVITDILKLLAITGIFWYLTSKSIKRKDFTGEIQK